MPKLAVMTWNVLWTEKADNVLDLISMVAPDILCCQELTTDSYYNPKRNMPKEIAELLNADYEYREGLTVRDRETAYKVTFGNAIFSKFPIGSRRYVRLRNDKLSADELQKRVYVEIGLDVQGQSLTVGTTHLSYVPYFKMTPMRFKEAENLYKAVGKPSSRFIFTGDMNASPDSAIVRTLAKRFKNVGPDTKQKTWTTKHHSDGDFKVNGLEWRLDYIFVTPDIKVISSQILDTKYSDHLPIVAELDT